MVLDVYTSNLVFIPGSYGLHMQTFSSIDMRMYVRVCMLVCLR